MIVSFATIILLGLAFSTPVATNRVARNNAWNNAGFLGGDKNVHPNQVVPKPKPKPTPAPAPPQLPVKGCAGMWPGPRPGPSAHRQKVRAQQGLTIEKAREMEAKTAVYKKRQLAEWNAKHTRARCCEELATPTFNARMSDCDNLMFSEFDINGSGGWKNYTLSWKEWKAIRSKNFLEGFWHRLKTLGKNLHEVTIKKWQKMFENGEYGKAVQDIFSFFVGARKDPGATLQSVIKGTPDKGVAGLAEDAFTRLGQAVKAAKNG